MGLNNNMLFKIEIYIPPQNFVLNRLIMVLQSNQYFNVEYPNMN